MPVFKTQNPLDFPLGLLESLATMGSGMASSLASVPYAEIGKLTPAQQQQWIAEHTYTPRTRSGQGLVNMLGEAGKYAEETLKLPPIMPELQGLAQLAAHPAAQAQAAQMARAGASEIGRTAAQGIENQMRRQGLIANIVPDDGVPDLSYRGSHTAPGPEFGAPLHDLTGGGQMYPADVYSANAARYYGTGYPKADAEAFNLAKRVRGNPDAEVTMYRAVPNKQGAEDINTGDWVTLSKDYAKTHGESVLDGDYKILSKKVKAKDLYTNADSIHEFGYYPQMLERNGQKLNQPSVLLGPQGEAMALAQKRAALPVSEGGLGLPANNTPEMRAKAMSGREAVHFSRHGGDYDVLDSGKYAIAPFDAIGTHVGSKQAAKERFMNTTATTDQIKGASYPVSVLGDRPMMNPEGLPWSEDALNAYLRELGGYNVENLRKTYPQLNQELRNKIFNEMGFTHIPYINDVEAKGVTSYIVPPENLRSQFAAFDPWRRNAAIATAMGLLAPDLLAKEEK